MTATIHDLEGEVLFSKGETMNHDRTDMPYPSQINPAMINREAMNHDINQARHRQMYALEAARLAASAMACQGFPNPTSRSEAILELAGRLLPFIIGE